MGVNKSDISIVSSFAFLALGLEVYLAAAYGIYADEIYYLVAIGLASAIGFLALASIFVSYLKERLLAKHEWEAPLIAAILVVVVQIMFFLWVFSLVIDHPIFLGRVLDAFSFSEVMSFLIPGLIIAYFSKE